MAQKPLSSLGGFAVGSNANIVIIDSTGNITTDAITVSLDANLGNVANIVITGGANGQFLQTDGNGVLSFAVPAATSNSAGPMPYLIPTGDSYIVNDNFQGLFANTITIDGDFTIDGELIEVGTADPAALFESVTSNNVLMEVGKSYIVDTTVSRTVLLPSSANVGFGDQVTIIDGTGNAYLSPISINGNGSNILGDANAYVLGVNDSAVTLVYYNSPRGWILSAYPILNYSP
jgi:hypothetical protein